MTTREQKINKIYEKIANKELIWEAFTADDEYKKVVSKKLSEAFKKEHNFNESHTKIAMQMCVFQSQIIISWIQIIDKEVKVMIWDVLEWVYLNIENKIVWNLLAIWNDWRKPIEEQSDECIDYIYNLLGND